jgi:translation initiation factor IF-2
MQEESPLSTRVHELAKELGVKSQDLLDRIQVWGFEVKSSIFAGLDPSTVEQIRGRYHSESAGGPATSPVAKPSSRPASPATPETSAIRSTAPAAPKSEASPAPPSPTTAAPVAATPPPTPAAPVPTTPHLAPEVKTAPAPASATPPAPPPAATLSQPARPATPPPAAQPPAPRASGLSGAPRFGSGSGPLSRHTPHRSGGGPAPATAGPGTVAPSARPEPRPNPTTAPPLRPSDYISPSGARVGGIRNLNTGGGSGAPRRPEGDVGPDGQRRDQRSTSRPLPQVATPSGAPQPQARRPESRPPAGPDTKTQRPEVRYTREQMLEMRQAGNLGVAPPPPPGRGPQGPPRPGAGGPPRPGAPRPGGGFGAPTGPLQGRGPGPGLRPGAAPVAPPAPIVDEEEEKKKGKGVGGATDRQGRRAKRDARAVHRGVNSPIPVAAITGDEEDSRSRGNRRGLHAQGRRGALAPARKSHAEIELPISVRSLSEATGIKANDLIRKLMNTVGLGVTINANLEEDAAVMLALEFGVELEVVYERTAEDDMLASFEDEEGDESELLPRPPVVTILGHVDHGKTSLLDRIRRSNVVDTESGGITQHIGAYTVDHNGKSITFVDTPGHEAFTAMRARGANVTDIVVLVVAADDGVMPQTQEAIAHAKAAEVPIIIALNKIDLPNVNLNKIYGELSQQGLAPEDYGGDTPVVKTSALTGVGIDDLLEMIGIVAEVNCDLRARPSRPATGTCLEALISEGRGAVARVLVQDGTLKVGDVMVCGDGFGRVRALRDDKGKSIEEAGPSTPVEVSGLDSVPTAGEKFAVIDDITRARDIAETRRERTRGVALGERQSITLENLYSKMAEQKIKSLNLILKADVQGSLEALSKELEKLENPEVPIRVLLKGVGGISESDILLADASQAIVIGFRVAPEDRAISEAEAKKIDIRRYDIIYQVTDEIKKAVEGMLVPEIKEVHLGRAVVRQMFKISKVGTVAGCFVTQGTFERSAKARLLREGREIYKGSIEALKRFKDDVKEVREGFECGIKITNFDDLKVDDVIEAYRVDVIRRTL